MGCCDIREGVQAHPVRFRTKSPELKPFGDHVRLLIETDRGETDITVDTADIHRLAGHRILLKDINGIRYLIPNWHTLKPHDRRLLDVYL